MRLTLPFCLALIAVIPACGPGGTSPCTEARHGCDNATSDFPTGVTCDTDDALQVVIGHGETAFAPLPEGVFPELYSGGQGGTHVYLGVRVMNAALDRYDQLKARFRLYTVEACDDGGVELPTGQCRFLYTGRNVILGRGLPLNVTDGVVEEFGILMQTDPASTYLRHLEVQIEDPCGRSGAHHVEIPPG